MTVVSALGVVDSVVLESEAGVSVGVHPNRTIVAKARTTIESSWMISSEDPLCGWLWRAVCSVFVCAIAGSLWAHEHGCVALNC